MKVLLNPPTFRPIELVCPHCQAKLLCELADFKRCSGGDFRESWDYAVCKCVCCDGYIQVESSRFPSHVYQKLPRDR